MKPVKFEEANCTYTAPGCGDLPVLRQEEVGGQISVTSVWKPSEEDLKVLNTGGCICLSVLGGQPPVLMLVQHVHITE